MNAPLVHALYASMWTTVLLVPGTYQCPPYRNYNPVILSEALEHEANIQGGGNTVHVVFKYWNIDQKELGGGRSLVYSQRIRGYFIKRRRNRYSPPLCSLRALKGNNILPTVVSGQAIQAILPDIGWRTAGWGDLPGGGRLVPVGTEPGWPHTLTNNFRSGFEFLRAFHGARSGLGSLL